MERTVLKDFPIFKEKTFVGASLLKRDCNTGVFSFNGCNKPEVNSDFPLISESKLGKMTSQKFTIRNYKS